MKKLICALPLLPLLFLQCSSDPSPIEYGADKCDFCRMTIVDRKFASEVMTNKGRTYKFDAIECMVHFIGAHQDIRFKRYLTNDYLGKGDMLDATVCSYLISPGIESPMGASLGAFASETEAEQVQMKIGGELYAWTQIQDTLSKKQVQ